jgi:hypothetical protein
MLVHEMMIFLKGCVALKGLSRGKLQTKGALLQQPHPRRRSKFKEKRSPEHKVIVYEDNLMMY